MRILGLDYGSKTVGVALTDETETIASPFETIFRKEENKLRRTLARIKEIADEYGVSEVVLGYPVRLNGCESAQTEKTLAFKALLEKRLQKEVALMDERLTTLEAEEVLTELGVPKREQKRHIDAIAASIILKDYLARKKEESQNGTDRI